MADYVTRVRTSSGDLQIDYNALANLPDVATKKYVNELNTTTNEQISQDIATKLNNKPDIYYGVDLDDAPTDVPNGTVFILIVE